MIGRNDMETMNMITDVVSDYLNVPKEFIFDTTRRRSVITARYLCIAFIREYTRSTLKDIADFFNKKDHSVIVHAVQTHKDLLDFDKKYMEICQNIKDMFDDNLESKVKMPAAYTLQKDGKFYGVFTRYKKALKCAQDIDAHIVEIKHLIC
jgi:hypothetical protein